jgi:sec-independent protein translocase protein TatB
MFDIAWSELLLIAVIALIFIGPKELPQVLHNLGRMTAKLRRSADDFRRQFEDSVREAGYDDLHKNIQDFRSLHPANQLKDSISRAINQEYTPKPPADPPLTVESKVPLSAAPEHASAEGASIAPVERPGLLEPKAPAEAAKDRVAPAA